MRLTNSLGLRRVVNSNFHPFIKIKSMDDWLKRERVRKFTGWQYGTRRDGTKHGGIKLNKLFIYQDMHRRDEERLEKFYSEKRIEAALAEHDFEYKHFKNLLNKAHILLDNPCLAKLAIYEPQSFHSLVALTKEMALREGREVLPDRDDIKYDVQLHDSLFSEPLPLPKIFQKGAAQDHKQKPRKLKPSEY